MLKIIVIAIATATLTGIVALLADPATEIGTNTPRAIKGDRLDWHPGVACSQHSRPVYDGGCVRDRRRPVRQAIEVRIV